MSYNYDRSDRPIPARDCQFHAAQRGLGQWPCHASTHARIDPTLGRPLDAFGRICRAGGGDAAQRQWLGGGGMDLWRIQRAQRAFGLVDLNPKDMMRGHYACSLVLRIGANAA